MTDKHAGRIFVAADIDTSFRMGYLAASERWCPDAAFTDIDRAACNRALTRWRDLQRRLYDDKERDAR